MQNAPWLVFLPGLTADHTLFDGQIDHFAGKCNVFVWDAPAHGLSRPYPLDFTMDDYARILHAILQIEDIQRPVLVGQSLGGYVAQAYMDLFPDCASDFISIDSAPLKKKYYPKWEIAALRHVRVKFFGGARNPFPDGRICHCGNLPIFLASTPIGYREVLFLYLAQVLECLPD